jgi:hypothetical protein
MNLQARLVRLRTALPFRGEIVAAEAGRRPPPSLRTPADVLGLLEEAAVAVRADLLAGPAEKARALGRLAEAALRAIEANNLAARVEMLEAVLKQRERDGKR